MFAHMFIPTDGSELSDRAIERGVELAKALGGRDYVSRRGRAVSSV